MCELFAIDTALAEQDQGARLNHKTTRGRWIAVAVACHRFEARVKDYFPAPLRKEWGELEIGRRTGVVQQEKKVVVREKSPL